MSNSEIFHPASKTLKKIFGDTDAYYQIPDYQRPYKWQDEQVEQLWDDLFTAFQSWKDDPKENHSYFLGSIILIQKQKDEPYDIVDGQQRLTTLTILFSVVRDLFPNLETRTINVIKNSIKNIVEDKQRLRFTTAIDKQNEFEHTIINGIKFPTKFRAADKSKYPYMNTALLFREKLEKLSAQTVNEFINYIFDHVHLISITCTSPTFAIRLFQVLNARGLDLSASDLTKSFLMNKLSSDKDREQFITNWRQIESISEDVQEGMDELLYYYLYFLKGANPEKGLFEEITKLMDGKNANTVMFELKRFCESFKDVMNLQSKSIYSLTYLKHQIYWKSILTSAKTLEYSEIEALANVLKNFYYLHWVAGYSSIKIKQTSFNLIQMVKEKKSISEIQTYLDSLVTSETKRRFKQALLGEVYKEQWLKPVLLVLEYAQVERTLNYISIDNNIHTEHILPEKNRKFEYWTQLYSEEDSERYLNSIANLTLLSGKQNIAASNNPFPDKIKIYEGKGKDGLVPFRISQRIRDNFVQGMKDWNKAALKERFEWIIGSIAKEFCIDLNDVRFEMIGNEIEPVKASKEIESESPEEATDYSNFHPECMDFVGAQLGVSFERISASVYRAKEFTATCRVSKEYDKAKKGYWFAFTLDLREILNENPSKNVLVLGCGRPDNALVIPGSEFLKHVDNLNTTVRPNQTYWHVHIIMDNSKYYLHLKGGGKVDVSAFALQKKTRAA